VPSLIKQCLFYIGILCVLTASTSLLASKGPWLSLPLTTLAQHKAGISGGEGFQKVISIVFAPSNPDIVYFSTDTAQIWKSIDGGLNWFSSGNGFSANGARSLFVFPNDPEHVLAAGFLGRERERVGQHLKPLQGIFRSTDGAKTWNFVHKAEFYKQDSTGALFVADSRTIRNKNVKIYAGDYKSGLLVSNDNGKHWQTTGFNQGHIIDMEEVPAKPGSLLIATNSGLYQFYDGEFKKIGKGLLHVPLSIAVSPAAPNRVYAVTSKKGVFISEDRGITFRNMSRGLPSVGINFSDLAVSPVDDNIVYLGTHKGYRKGPFYSSTGGEKWYKSSSVNAKKLTASGGFYFSSPFAPDPVKPLVALSASNGKARILRTENGGKSWFYSGSGYTGARIRNIAFKTDGEIMLSLTDHGVWVSSNKESIFQPLVVSTEKGKSSSAVAISDSTIVASMGGWKEKKLMTSRDGGNEWELHDDVKGKLSFIAFHPRDKKVIYSGANRSDDFGKNWKKLSHEVIAMSMLNGDVVYAIGKKRTRIYLSKNRGFNWSKLPALPDKVLIYNVVIDPADETRLYIASSRGVYIFNGKDWLHRGSEHGLQKDIHGLNHIKSIAVDPLNSNVIYAGKWAPGKGLSNGIFRSQDKGVSWKPFNFNLGSNYNVWTISVNPYNGTVYAGTTYGLKKIITKGFVNE